jgi:hypothetical protein
MLFIEEIFPFCSAIPISHFHYKMLITSAASAAEARIALRHSLFPDKHRPLHISSIKTTDVTQEQENKTTFYFNCIVVSLKKKNRDDCSMLY